MEKAQAFDHITKHPGYVGCIKLNIGGREVLFEGKVPVPSETDVKVCVARSDPDGMLIPGSRLSPDYGTFTEAFTAMKQISRQYPGAAVFSSQASAIS